MTARRLSINLLTQDEFASSLMGKFLLWSLSIGRYIVVFTELIVILSFLSRFSLDRQLTDINTEIVRQKAIITSYGDLEERIRFAQNQIALVRTVDESLKSPDVLLMLTGLIPSDVRLEKLSISGNHLTIEGTSLTSGGFIRLLVGLLNYHELVEGVSVDSVSSQNNDLQLEFSMDITLKEALITATKI